MAGSNLTGQFIANTYQNLVQKPDLNKEEYYNGIGQAITVINRDAIGTVKMYGGNLSGKFDISTGLGVVGSDWQGWALCDGRNSTPDLRGRFIAGHTYTYTGDTSTNSQKNNTAFDTVGKNGAGKYTNDDTKDPKIHIDNVPPHRHGYTFFTQEYMGEGNWGSYHNNLLSTTFQSSVGNDDGSSGTRLDNGNDSVNRRYYTNTGDGTSNYSNQNGLKSTPDNFYPAYATLVYVIRVS